MALTQEQITDGISMSISTFISALGLAVKSILEVKIEFDHEKGVSEEAEGFQTSYETISCVPFSGPITGEFFICLESVPWQHRLAQITGLPSSGPEIEELGSSAYREIINTAAGDAIAVVREKFGAVTLMAPRLIEGKLTYPKTKMFRFFMDNNEQGLHLEVWVSFDLMEQELNIELGRLAKDSRLDHTGLFNKKYFTRVVDDLQKGRRPPQGPGDISVMYIDINRLKYVNDHLGHEAGDRYIKIVCDTLSEVVRTEDQCFRIGGDELVAILYKCSQNSAKMISDRLSQCIASKELHVKKEDGSEEILPVAASIGVASTDEGLGISELISTADKRMEENKRAWYEMQNLTRRG